LAKTGIYAILTFYEASNLQILSNSLMNSKKPIKSKADILKFFYKASVPKNELLIGIEVERSAVFETDLSPVQYSGSSGYLAILKKLAEEVGWKIIEQDENGNITALKRGGSEIHIEFDGRIELVSKPRKGLFSLNREYQMHAREIDEISKEFGIQWVAMGWQPFAKTKDIKFVFPKKFNSASRHYTKQYPDFQKNIYKAWERKNDGIHVNFGYTSEKDAINKFQTLFKISPILVAMFANSPLSVGRFSGFFHKRLHSTYYCCPHRTRIQRAFLEEDFSFEKWVDYLLKLPMRRIDRKGKQIFVPLSFHDFLKNGYRRHNPRIEDFYLHIKSVWNEIRIKHYLEYRAFDTVPPHLILSIPAIIRALTLNSDVMRAVQKLVKNWSFSDHLEIREKVYKYALQAETPNGKKVLDLAKELLEIASFSLQERHNAMKHSVDASRYLWPIKEYIFVREQSPAEYVMEMWNGEWHRDPRKLLEWSKK
jgi:glutamate--cysteine ligase